MRRQAVAIPGVGLARFHGWGREKKGESGNGDVFELGRQEGRNGGMGRIKLLDTVADARTNYF